MVMSSQNEENQGNSVNETFKVRQGVAKQEIEFVEKPDSSAETEAETSSQLGAGRRVFDPKKETEASPADTVSASNVMPEAPEDNAELENFSDLLEEHEGLVEKKEFYVGQVVEGVIVQIGGEFAYVNIGSKAEASIAVSELMNPEDGKLAQVVGDTIKAKVVAFDQSGIKLSRTLRGGNLALEEAYRAGQAVKATVKAVNKGGYELEVMGQRAFCPLSQIAKTYSADPNEHIGNSYDFKIIKYAKKGRDLVLSRSVLLEEESKAKREEVLSTLKVGDIVSGTVSSVQDYGAFVDLGGVDGLIHVSEISYQHITNPKEVLELGQEVKVYVLNIEETPKGPKLSLSMKKLEEDPFHGALNSLHVGSRVQGIVKRNTKFGSFIEIAPGVEGLVHISEISWDRSLKRVDDVLKVGMSIETTILSIDPENRRISLSVKDSQKNPWDEIEERYAVGTKVSGSVESIADFGVFVKLEPGVVALLPLSEISSQTQEIKQAKTGDTIEANVILVDPERKRLTLSTKSEGEVGSSTKQRSSRSDEGSKVKRDNRDAREKRVNENEYKEVKGSFASFGDVFSQLKKKK